MEKLNYIKKYGTKTLKIKGEIYWNGIMRQIVITEEKKATFIVGGL